MKRILKPIIILIVLFAIILIVTNKWKGAPVKTENVVGCYVLRNEKNVYTLNLQTQNGSSVSGTMRYDNFQFDDSSGTFIGIYENDILLGDYSFNSEGMDSIVQHTFKRSGDNFVQGTGEYTTIDGREVFVDLSTVTWNADRVFMKSVCE